MTTTRDRRTLLRLASQGQSHKSWQQEVRDLAELYGWTCYCTWDSRHSPAGEPDLRLLRMRSDGTAEAVVAELKVGKDTVKPAQARALTLWGKVPGVRAYVWRPESWDDIIEALK